MTMDRLKRLRESQDYFRGRAETRVRILKFRDGSTVVCDGRKTLLANPERELELRSRAEVITVDGVGEARRYLGASLSASYLSLNEEGRTKYLVWLAKDYRDILNLSVKGLVKVLAEDTGTSRSLLRRYLPDEFKEAKKKHVGMRHAVSHPSTAEKEDLVPGTRISRIEMIDSLLNWLDREDPVITEKEARFLRTLKEILSRIKGLDDESAMEEK